MAAVRKVAREAVWWRDRAVKVMDQARRLGASDEQLAEASGLSVGAVRALLERWSGRHPSDHRPR